MPTTQQPPTSKKDMIATLKHLRALRSEAQSASNRHVPSGTVAAHVRMATGTSRRKSADVRFVRRMRMRGKQPRCLDEIVVSPRLAENAVYIKRDKSIIILARDWSMALLPRHSGCASTARSGRSLGRTTNC